MAFRKPISTLGGLTWWKNIQQDMYFIMQEHKVGFPVWPYKYRILMRENRMEIANSSDKNEIKMDWQYLQHHAVPQLEQKIDLGSTNSIETLGVVIRVIGKFLL